MKDEKIIVRCGKVIRSKVDAERKRMLEEEGLSLSLSQTATMILNRGLSVGPQH